MQNIWPATAKFGPAITPKYFRLWGILASQLCEIREIRARPLNSDAYKDGIYLYVVDRESKVKTIGIDDVIVLETWRFITIRSIDHGMMIIKLLPSSNSRWQFSMKKRVLMGGRRFRSKHRLVSIICFKSIRNLFSHKLYCIFFLTALTKNLTQQS